MHYMNVLYIWEWMCTWHIHVCTSCVPQRGFDCTHGHSVLFHLSNSSMMRCCIVFIFVVAIRRSLPLYCSPIVQDGHWGLARLSIDRGVEACRRGVGTLVLITKHNPGNNYFISTWHSPHDWNTKQNMELSNFKPREADVFKPHLNTTTSTTHI